MFYLLLWQLYLHNDLKCQVQVESFRFLGVLWLNVLVREQGPGAGTCPDLLPSLLCLPLWGACVCVCMCMCSHPRLHTPAPSFPANVHTLATLRVACSALESGWGLFGAGVAECLVPGTGSRRGGEAWARCLSSVGSWDHMRRGWEKRCL